MTSKVPYNADTGGVTPMNIEGRLFDQRERLRGMTDEDRKFRAQFLKDQRLAPHEPVTHLPELYYDLVNPIRRFYRKPLDMVFDKLRIEERFGRETALCYRFFIGKALLLIASGYVATYYFMYNRGTWERKHGWHVHIGREPVYPGEPGYPKLSNRTFADYCDREFKNSPI
nr:PREDICTED: uncharacterized protein LOC109029740 [Bemisia tabaci]XP_018895892.1 PREDICTED: uncharacterized protein LOC109029740 [Bemisia tabaci]